jgi:hypothetical protein
MVLRVRIVQVVAMVKCCITAETAADRGGVLVSQERRP